MVYAIILAGGTGTRMGNQGIPKQFLTIQDKPIIIHTLEKFLKINEINKIIIVCHKQYCDYMKNLLIEYGISNDTTIVEGGKTRMDSILQGIKVIIDNNEVSKNDIFISTDSVRPMVRKEELLELIKKSKKYNAVSIVNPIIENIVKLNEDGEIEQIFKREKLFKDLSPQAFNIQKFTECLKKIDKEQLDKITDLSELFINCKEKVATIVGNTDNIKITTPIDIKIVNELIKKEEV